MVVEPDDKDHLPPGIYMSQCDSYTILEAYYPLSEVCREQNQY